MKKVKKLTDIKVKNKSNTFIKTLDKSLIVADKTKDKLVTAKEKINNTSNSGQTQNE